jgi:hypothetical protein
MTATSPSAQVPARRAPMLALLAVAFAIGGVIGAYMDWTFWVAVYGQTFLTSLAAIVVLLVAGRVAFQARSRQTVRRIALVAVAVALGVLVGQAVGPSREPLEPSTGTMTLRLTSPTIATAVGPALCQNVASATDFKVENDYTVTHLDTTEQALVSILISKGERWNVRPGPRKDDVLLRIRISPTPVVDDGGPTEFEMDAGPSSTLVSSFSNEGGSIAFSNLEPRVAADLTGEPMELVGTVEWTCGGAL